MLEGGREGRRGGCFHAFLSCFLRCVVEQGPQSANGEGNMYCFVASTGQRQEGSVCTRHEAMQTRGRGERGWCLVNTTVARTPHKQCVGEKKCGTINKVRTRLDTTITTTKYKQDDTHNTCWRQTPTKKPNIAPSKPSLV